MAVRLFVGNLSYSHDRSRSAHLLRNRGAALAGRAAGRSRNRPAARVRVRGVHGSRARRAGDSAFNGQAFNGRPLAVSEARAREDRGPGGPPAFGSAARRLRARGPPVVVRRRPPRPFDPNARAAPRAQPQLRTRRQAAARRQRQGQEEGDERPRGPIPLKTTGRSFTLDDAIDDRRTRSEADRRRFRDEQAAGRHGRRRRASEGPVQRQHGRDERLRALFAAFPPMPLRRCFVQPGARCSRVRMWSNAVSSSSIMRGVRFARA